MVPKKFKKFKRTDISDIYIICSQLKTFYNLVQTTQKQLFKTRRSTSCLYLGEIKLQYIYVCRIQIKSELKTFSTLRLIGHTEARSSFLPSVRTFLCKQTLRKFCICICMFFLHFTELPREGMYWVVQCTSPTSRRFPEAREITHEGEAQGKFSGVEGNFKVEVVLRAMFTHTVPRDGICRYTPWGVY